MRTTPRRVNRPVGDEEAGTRKKGATGTGRVSVNARLNLEAVERTLAALSGGKENDALGLDTVLVKGLHDMAIDEAIERAGRKASARAGKGIVHDRKGPTVSVPEAVKTPAAVRAIVAKALAGKVLSKREQDRLRDELERREGAVPGKPPASSPFTPPPPPVNTPVGLARRYPAMTCGDTNESADTDASPPFAMTPTPSPRLRGSRWQRRDREGTVEPARQGARRGERGEPLTSTQRNILDAVEELRLGKILPIDRMRLLEWAQTDDDDVAVVKGSGPMTSSSTVASLCAAARSRSHAAERRGRSGVYVSDEVFSFDRKIAENSEEESPEPWISPVEFNRGKSMTPTLEELARRKEGGEALTEGEDAMVSIFKLASPAPAR